LLDQAVEVADPGVFGTLPLVEFVAFASNKAIILAIGVDAPTTFRRVVSLAPFGLFHPPIQRAERRLIIDNAAGVAVGLALEVLVTSLLLVEFAAFPRVELAALLAGFLPCVDRSRWPARARRGV
jgi:hypothetical protein